MCKIKKDLRVKKYTFASFKSTVELTKPGAVRPDSDHPSPVTFTGLCHETII